MRCETHRFWLNTTTDAWVVEDPLKREGYQPHTRLHSLGVPVPQHLETQGTSYKSAFTLTDLKTLTRALVEGRQLKRCQRHMEKD